MPVRPGRLRVVSNRLDQRTKTGSEKSESLLHQERRVIANRARDCYNRWRTIIPGHHSWTYYFNTVSLSQLVRQSYYLNSSSCSPPSTLIHVLGSTYEYLNKIDIVWKLQWCRFQICCQSRSTPGSLRLYGLASKDWLRGDSGEARATRHSWYSNWKSAQPASSRHSYLSNSPTVTSPLVDYFCLRAAQSHMHRKCPTSSASMPLHS